MRFEACVFIQYTTSSLSCCGSSTLWQMGMKEDFWKARDWVRDHLDFSKVKQAVSVFETCIRNLGGLLSAYDLSGDDVFLRKADDLGQRLIKAFENPNGIPYGEVELFEGGHASNTGWHANKAVLSEIGTLQLEFRYLAHVTGKEEYATKAMRALDQLLSLKADYGLYPTYIYNLDDLRLGGRCVVHFFRFCSLMRFSKLIHDHQRHIARFVYCLSRCSFTSNSRTCLSQAQWATVSTNTCSRYGCRAGSVK